MAWETIQQERPRIGAAGAIRVSVSEFRGARLLNVTIGEAAVKAAGLAAGEMMALQRGGGEHEGWFRLARGGAETRGLGRVPHSLALILRFRLPPDWLPPLAPSALCPEWAAEPGALTARLPDWARAAASRPAIALREPPIAPKPTTRVPAPDAEASALSLLRSRVGTDQVVRETGLSPREVVRLADQVKAERAGRAA